MTFNTGQLEALYTLYNVSPLTPTNLSNSGSPCPQLLCTGVSGSLPSSFGTLTWNGTGYVFYLIP